MSSNASSIAIDVFASPGEAFNALKEHPRFLLPWLLLCLGTALITFGFINTVDIAWLMERPIAQNPDLTEQQIQGIRQFAELVAGLPQSGVALALAVVAPISTTLWLLAQAFYLKIITWITRDRIGYALWFGLVCFSALPGVLRMLATGVNLMVSDTRTIALERINPISFGNLFDLEATEGLQAILVNLDPTTVWTLVLLVLGYRIISGKGYGPALAVILGPLAIVAGLVVAF